MKTQAVYSSFSVNDLNKAKEFYTGILGLNIENDDMGLKLQLPNGGTVFVYPKDDHQPATFTIMNFVVDNIDETVDELKSQGIEFEHYDGYIKTDEKGIARGKSINKGPDIAWFKDPAKNIIAVMQN